jgi:hypothetical protein
MTMPALISRLLQKEEHGLNVSSSSANGLNDCFFIQKPWPRNYIIVYRKGANLRMEWMVTGSVLTQNLIVGDGINYG